MSSKIANESTGASWSWQLLLMALLVVGTPIALAFDAWSDTFRLAWQDEESNYIFLGPLVVAWIVWARRDRLVHCRPGGMVLGPVLLGLGWLMWSYGYRHRVWSLWHTGPVLMLVGAILSVVGRRTLYELWPAFVALLFLTPISPFHRQGLAQPLQVATAKLAQSTCDFMGVYVDRFGNVLSVNGLDVAVAEACNGMRMVITLLVVMYVVVFTTPMHPAVRLGVLLLSPVIAIICNVLRLVPTVWMFGNASQTAAEAFHDWSGWAMLFVAFFGLKGVVNLLHPALSPGPRVIERRQAAVGVGGR
jgi:exosortase